MYYAYIVPILLIYYCTLAADNNSNIIFKLIINSRITLEINFSKRFRCRPLAGCIDRKRLRAVQCTQSYIRHVCSCVRVL